MKLNDTYYLLYLENELSNRCEQNPAYSSRAFARALVIDPSALSRILSGKQIPSYSYCEKICFKLGLTPEQKKKFLQSVAIKHRNSNQKRIAPQFRKFEDTPTYRINLSMDQWRVISDWYYGAIIELTDTKGFHVNAKWISQKLGISEIIINQAIKRLIRLNLLKFENNILVKTHNHVSSGDTSLTTSAHKKLQLQILSKAKHSIENDPIETRSMTSMTMAIDPKKLKDAKLMIQEFQRKLCEFLESGERTQVYQLGINLFPISKGDNK